MIKQTSYTKEWIDSRIDIKKKINPVLCEKMIRALGLLEQLVIQGLDFVFKGGTSLILLIDDPQRFSIDIDINTEETKEHLEVILKKIQGQGLFSRYEENERNKTGIPKAHYKFFYDSSINGNGEYILLDVLFHKHSYPKIIETPVKSLWLDTDDHTVYTVNTPGIESILGDKMVASAPNTTGIPYGKDKSIEIIKQIFDVGRLFDVAENLQEVSESFKINAVEESKFRNMDIQPQDVLIDIIQTGLLIAQSPTKVKAQKEKFDELMEGIRRFGAYPIGIRYKQDEAIVSSAKSAYLATLILNKEPDLIMKYKQNPDFLEIDIPSEYNYIQKLKKRVPEAYYYWEKVFNYTALLKIELRF